MGTWKSVAKVVTYPFAHPTNSWQWIKSSSKVAAVTLPATYIGWEKLTTDKSVCRIVGEATVGEKNVNRMDAVAGDLDKVHKSAGKAIDKVSSTLSDVDSQLGGAKKFFQTHYDILTALADGEVTGIGSNARHGLYVDTAYGNYTVRFAHLSSVNAMFGQAVKAGKMLGISGELLHLEVHYGEEEVNPIDFLQMLFSNLKMYGMKDLPDSEREIVTIDADITTGYDNRREEVERLMTQYFPSYMQALRDGTYNIEKHVRQSIGNLFTVSALKGYFFEAIPSMSNPLGVGKKAAPIAGKVQNLLITDFLSYLALKHHVFLSGLTGDEKKN